MFGLPMFFGPFAYGMRMMDPAVFMHPQSYVWGVGPYAWGPCPLPWNPINFFF